MDGGCLIPSSFSINDSFINKNPSNSEPHSSFVAFPPFSRSLLADEKERPIENREIDHCKTAPTLTNLLPFKPNHPQQLAAQAAP